MTVSPKALVSLGCVGLLAGCTSFFDVAIETPLTPKLDISRFQRVLIAGFVSGGSDDVDANLETARLLRSQLRRSADLQVVDADVLPLLEIAAEQGGGPEPPDERGGETIRGRVGGGRGGRRRRADRR